MEFMFFLVLGIFVFTFVKTIGEWSKNNKAPRLSVEATVVTKRTQTHRHHHSGHAHISHTNSYYVTFQVESGDRMELYVPGSEYGMLAEGDFGVLSFQGTRYLGFERSYKV